MSVEAWKSICYVGTVVTGNKINEKQAAQLRQFDKDLIGAKKGVADANVRAEGFRLEIAKTNESAAKSTRAGRRTRIKPLETSKGDRTAQALWCLNSYRLEPVELVATESRLKSTAHARCAVPTGLWGGSADPRWAPDQALPHSTTPEEPTRASAAGRGACPTRKTKRYYLLEADRLRGGGLRPGDGC